MWPMIEDKTKCIPIQKYQQAISELKFMEVFNNIILGLSTILLLMTIYNLDKIFHVGGKPGEDAVGCLVNDYIKMLNKEKVLVLQYLTNGNR